METKLQINNPAHEAYLRFVMNSKHTGPIKIERTNEVGKYICSRIRYSNLPVKQSSGTIVELPKRTLESRDVYYLYFTVEDQKKINDYLASSFLIYFRSYMLVGNEQRIQKKSLLEAFISKLNLQNNATVYENLKKTDYRNRKKMVEFLDKAIQQLVN